MNEPAVAPVVNKRTPYSDRWTGFAPDERARIAGDADTAADLDELLDRLAEMPDEERDELVARWLHEVETIRMRLDATEAHTRRLREQRRLLFIRLLLAGEAQAQVATRADVSSMVVSYETGIATRQR